MKIVLYDANPKPNPWLSVKIFGPLFKHCRSAKMDISIGNNLEMKNSTILLHAKHLNPETIMKLKNNNNKICSFDVNDSTWLSDTYAYTDEAKLIDVIFKFAGIQKTSHSPEIQIDEDLNFTEWQKPFTNNVKHAEIYNHFKDNDKFVPMPHVGFYHHDVRPIPIKDRNRIVLVRGSNRYLRYLLFLKLMQKSLVDENSAHFCSFKYDKSFTHCRPCIAEKEKTDKISYEFYKKLKCEGCSVTENLPWTDPDTTGMKDKFQPNQQELWNGKCLPLHYWLAEKFNQKYGGIDFNIVDKTLNCKFTSEPEALRLISHYMFYGDYKWIFSIDIPPRFWQAANAGSVNIMPKWVENQRHFPELIEDEHYVSYGVKLDNLEKLNTIEIEKLQHISDNAKAVYEKWIKPGVFNLSDNLLKYICERIEN